MPWTTPKIDWTSEDFLNYGDYNRVKTNIEYVAALIPQYVSSLAQTSMTAITGYDATLTAAQLDVIATNLIAMGETWMKPYGWAEIQANWESSRKPSRNGISHIDVNAFEGNVNLLKLHEEMYRNSVMRCGETLDICENKADRFDSL